MTKTAFIKGATPIGFTVSPKHGEPILLSIDPALTRGGSCGWRWKGALYVPVGGEWVRALGSVQLTVIESKKWPADIDATGTGA